MCMRFCWWLGFEGGKVEVVGQLSGGGGGYTTLLMVIGDVDAVIVYEGLSE
jgi:hypothetical protein